MNEYKTLEKRTFVWEIEGIATGILFADSMVEAKHIVALNLPEIYMNSPDTKVRVFPLAEWQRTDTLHIFPENTGIYMIR